MAYYRLLTLHVNICREYRECRRI